MIKPSRGYCLIEPLEAEEVSAGGVYMPERAKDLPNRGKVLAVGEPPLEYFKYAQYLPAGLPFREGDIVIYKKFVDNRVKKEGKEYLLVPFSDILGIDEEEKNKSL